jgi:histidinol-phosphate aminotransferase
LNRYLSEKARNIAPYTAGEQPAVTGLIKLNTNENPYPPSPEVIKSIASAANETLRLYPKTDGGDFRAAAAELEGVPAVNVFCANGSDELLAFAFLAFFDKTGKIKMPEITYSFYPVWSELYDIPFEPVPLRPDFTVDPASLFSSEGGVVLPNPNAPTGLLLPLGDVEAIVKNNADNVVILDEAYAAFGAESAVSLTNKYENLLVVKTLSKSHALAGLRCAYAVGSPLLINGLERIRDSFNSYPLDRLAQAGAAAALRDRAYYRDTAARVVNTRERVRDALIAMGFDVPPSRSNFLFIEHKSIAAKELQQALRNKNILVRHFDKPLIKNRLRVSIGTDKEMDVFLKETAEIFKEA